MVISNSWIGIYTTNPTERSTAAIKRSTNESGLEWSVESHRTLVKQWPSKSVEHSASARWHSTGYSKSFSFVERSMAAVERLVGLVVYMEQTDSLEQLLLHISVPQNMNCTVDTCTIILSGTETSTIIIRCDIQTFGCTELTFCLRFSWKHLILRTNHTHQSRPECKASSLKMVHKFQESFEFSPVFFKTMDDSELNYSQCIAYLNVVFFTVMDHNLEPNLDVSSTPCKRNLCWLYLLLISVICVINDG